MKNILRGIVFWTIVVAFILLITAIANVLSNLITIELVMTIVYIALGFSFIYILKN